MLPTIDTEPDCQFREISLIFQVQISIILNVQNVRQKFPKSLAGSKLAKKRPSQEPKFRLFAIVQGPNQLCISDTVIHDRVTIRWLQLTLLNHVVDAYHGHYSMLAGTRNRS